MSPRPADAALPALASVDDIIEILESTNDRAELIALLAPMRLPDGLSDDDRARVTGALIAASSRCWRGRS